MNSYFQAISEATCNGKLPEYSDLWRCYHLTALMLDSDYCYFDEESNRFSTTTQEEEITGSDSQKLLYVPVTRKVITTDGN